MKKFLFLAIFFLSLASVVAQAEFSASLLFGEEAQLVWVPGEEEGMILGVEVVTASGDTVASFDVADATSVMVFSCYRKGHGWSIIIILGDEGYMNKLIEIPGRGDQRVVVDQSGNLELIEELLAASPDPDLLVAIGALNRFGQHDYSDRLDVSLARPDDPDHIWVFEEPYVLGYVSDPGFIALAGDWMFLLQDPENRKGGFTYWNLYTGQYGQCYDFRFDSGKETEILEIKTEKRSDWVVIWASGE